MAEKIPLYYTFGNHMHWVDMEWLWGYHVLPGSVRDMLHFCQQTGAKGNVNFDGIGYEKLAAEAPAALADLRQAVQRGRIEVVGASYGQPYGLFHGGESNVRQLIYGVRTVTKLLGVRPRTFWEEEFYFFPQLPQLLRGVGYHYASLFFQWTWHTPEIPWETMPAIWWEGMDGSRILAATRNRLNLHQWPEDFVALLESPVLRTMPVPGIIQWLELMPSPDWMCRSELMLPPLFSLKANPNFDLKFVTLSEYLEAAKESAEPRCYSLDDVFHGMSLGKNGDLFRRLSRRSEYQALTAESLATLMGFFGRPYPQWDVYPTWELEEAWRELLAAQHHDNDECEGLCGHVGRRSYERSMRLTEHIIHRSLTFLADRTVGPPGRLVVYNPLGWERDDVITDPQTGKRLLLKGVPPMGYRVLADLPSVSVPPTIQVEENEDGIALQRGPLTVRVDRRSGMITQITGQDFPQGVLHPDTPMADLTMLRNGQPETFEAASVTRAGSEQEATIRIQRHSREGHCITITVALASALDAVDITYTADEIPKPDPKMHAALQTTIGVNLSGIHFIHDHPYGVSPIRADGTYTRKYPTGDWMTSPQVYEKVYNPFTALHFVDLTDGERGLLYIHDGSQAFFRDGDRARNILSMYDAWDEDYFVAELHVRVRLIPHGRLSHAQRWKLAQEFNRPLLVASSHSDGGILPTTFAPLWCDASNVAVTALYRETKEPSEALSDYVAADIAYPTIVRLVELNGDRTSLHLKIAGPIAAAYRTNLLGELQEKLAPTKTDAPLSGPLSWYQLHLELRPYEIATLYLDAVQARKVTRDLDSYRSVWATAHRVDD